MSADIEHMMFSCPVHRFVVNASTDGWVNSHGTPEHRVMGCAGCDQAVNDAFDYAGVST